MSHWTFPDCSTCGTVFTSSPEWKKAHGQVCMNCLPKARTILDEALEITGNGGERNDSYDHPRPNFEAIAGVWSHILRAKITADITANEVALLMIGMKCVREAHKHKRDNLVDIAGYARCIERLEERPSQEKSE